MASTLIIRAIPQSDSFEWAALSEGSSGESMRGTLSQLAATVREFTAHVQLVFLVPAVDALVRVFDFTEKERKHVMKTIPYMLEEDLLGEADDLHFVHGNDFVRRTRLEDEDLTVFTRNVDLAVVGDR